jgi:hypothetical protein
MRVLIFVNSGYTRQDAGDRLDQSPRMARVSGVSPRDQRRRQNTEAMGTAKTRQSEIGVFRVRAEAERDLKRLGKGEVFQKYRATWGNLGSVDANLGSNRAWQMKIFKSLHILRVSEMSIQLPLFLEAKRRFQLTTIRSLLNVDDARTSR